MIPSGGCRAPPIGFYQTAAWQIVSTVYGA